MPRFWANTSWFDLVMLHWRTFFSVQSDIGSDLGFGSGGTQCEIKRWALKLLSRVPILVVRRPLDQSPGSASGLSQSMGSVFPVACFLSGLAFAKRGRWSDARSRRKTAPIKQSLSQPSQSEDFYLRDRELPRDLCAHARRTCCSWEFAGCIIFWHCHSSGWVFSRLVPPIVAVWWPQVWILLGIFWVFSISGKKQKCFRQIFPTEPHSMWRTIVPAGHPHQLGVASRFFVDGNCFWPWGAGVVGHFPILLCLRFWEKQRGKVKSG